MSRLWRDELRVGLRPDRVVALRYRRGWVRRLVARSAARVERTAGGSAWDAPIEALAKILDEDAALTVILSSHFVRYAVLPWNRSLASREEWQVYARHVLAQTYGAAATAWKVTLCPTGPKKPWLACAVDAALIESLQHAAQAAGARLVSVQPYLAAAFNRCRSSIGHADAWLALHEDDRVTLASIMDGAWRAVRSRRVGTAWAADLPGLIEREALLDGTPAAASRICVLSEDEAVREMRNAQDLTLAPGSARELRAYAMALA